MFIDRQEMENKAYELNGCEAQNDNRAPKIVNNPQPELARPPKTKLTDSTLPRNDGCDIICTNQPGLHQLPDTKPQQKQQLQQLQQHKHTDAQPHQKHQENNGCERQHETRHQTDPEADDVSAGDVTRPWYARCMLAHRRRSSKGARWWDGLLCPPHGEVGAALTFVLAALLLWAASWGVLKGDALPGGNVFGLVMVYVWSIAGGAVVSKVHLPPLLGERRRGWGGEGVTGRVRGEII